MQLGTELIPVSEPGKPPRKMVSLTDLEKVKTDTLIDLEGAHQTGYSWYRTKNRACKEQQRVPRPPFKRSQICVVTDLYLIHTSSQEQGKKRKKQIHPKEHSL